MDAVAVVMVGAGVWIMYSAYKGHDPFTVALGILQSPTSDAGTTGQTAATLPAQYQQFPAGQGPPSPGAPLNSGQG